MAKFFSGKDGSLKVKTGSNTLTEIAKLQSWDFSMSMAVIESTSMGDTDRILHQGIRSYSGSARAYYYMEGAAGSSSNVKTILEAAIKEAGVGSDQGAESDQLTIEMRLEDGSTGDRTIQFNCRITSIGMSSSVGEVSSVDFSWEADGAPLSGSGNLIG